MKSKSLPDLLDASVWLALSDEDHIHHERAKRYWASGASERVAFCRLTMIALLRLVTNVRAIPGGPLSPSEAWALYRGYRAIPFVDMLREPEGFEDQMASWSDREGFPTKHWTDCALAAWALASGCRLVSFDRDYLRFEGLDFLHLTV